MALHEEGAVGAVAQIPAFRDLWNDLSRLVSGAAGMGSVGERDGETLANLRTALVPNQNRDERPEMFDVQRVRRRVSPLVMVTVVIGGRRRGSIGYDGAVGSV